MRQFFADVYRPLRLRGKTQNAVRLHEVTLNNFQRFLCREPKLADLTDETISRFLCWMSERGRSAYTVNDNLYRLSALWRFANRRGLVSTWPDIQPEIEPEREPQAWTVDEVATLLATCRHRRGLVGGVPASLFWVALILTCFATAERIGAVMQLEWSNVDLRRAWVSIPAQFRKGKRQFKSFQIHPDALSALVAIQFPRRALVFPWEMSLGTLYNHFDAILTDAGLPHDRASKFHRLRKTAASYYKAAGGDATEFLGHSSKRVTERYLDPRICGGAQPAHLLPRVS